MVNAETDITPNMMKAYAAQYYYKGVPDTFDRITNHITSDVSPLSNLISAHFSTLAKESMIVNEADLTNLKIHPYTNPEIISVPVGEKITYRTFFTLQNIGGKVHINPTLYPDSVIKFNVDYSELYPPAIRCVLDRPF